MLLTDPACRLGMHGNGRFAPTHAHGNFVFASAPYKCTRDIQLVRKGDTLESLAAVYVR